MSASMRFFRRELHSGDLTDEASNILVRQYYEEHLPAIAGRLPTPLSQLAFGKAADGSPLTLHDAQIRRISLDRPKGTLELELRVGDLQSGYFNLDLHYSRVQIDMLEVDSLRRIANDSTVELLYDEVDIDDAHLLSHRILFWPYDEVEVRFRDFSWQRQAAPGRAFERTAAPFREIH